MTQTDQDYLDKAVRTVATTLGHKQGEWTPTTEAFHNFDIMKEFGVTALEFALMMCRLKMERIKSRTDVTDVSLQYDPALEDSIKDLACYATIALGIIEREKARNAENTETEDRSGANDIGRFASWDKAADKLWAVHQGQARNNPITR